MEILDVICDDEIVEKYTFSEIAKHVFFHDDSYKHAGE